jgi:methanethiol oxidase
VLDTKPDPRHPKVVHGITAEELATKAGYSRPHTVHCGPGGIFLFSLGGANGNDGPGGVAPIDHDTFEVVGPWEFEHGLDPEDLLGRRFGHHLNFWSMSQRKLTQRVDLGDQHQLVFELRPAHDPAKAWGSSGW